MGSLATVKVLREKTPTELTKDLLKEISSKSQSVSMGGLFSNPAAPTPPKDLTKLLEDIVKEDVKENAKENAKETHKEKEKVKENVKELTSSRTVDTIIKASRWGQEFREYLKAEEHIAILR